MQEIIGNCEIVKGVINMDVDPINSLIEWLKAIKVLNENDELIQYNDMGKWERSGGETYFSHAKIDYLNEGNHKTKYIAFKAIVTINSEKAFKDWRRRRDILIAANIPVSNWYYAEEAIIVEDFYEGNVANAKIIDDIKLIGEKLDRLGFSCLNYIADIRCDKEGNPFYIDFGFDLGEPNISSTNVCQKTFNNYINSIK